MTFFIINIVVFFFEFLKNMIGNKTCLIKQYNYLKKCIHIQVVHSTCTFLFKDVDECKLNPCKNGAT